MPEIMGLRGIAQSDAQKLRQKGIARVDDLWRCVGVDFERGVTKVAAVTGVSPEILYSLLIADSMGGTRRRIEVRPFQQWLGIKPLWTFLRWTARHLINAARDWRRYWSESVALWFGLKLLWIVPKQLWFDSKRLWPARHSYWLEAVLGVATILLVAMALRAGLVRRTMTDHVVVKPVVRLSPHRSIRAEDVIVERTPSVLGSFTSVDMVTGRYPLQEIAPGTAIRGEHLMTEEMSYAMKGRLVLSIPVRYGALSSALVPPARVWILLTLREPKDQGPQPVLVKDVILLSINRHGETSSVEAAVTEDGMKSLESLLGVADVFVLQPAT